MPLTFSNDKWKGHVLEYAIARVKRSKGGSARRVVWFVAVPGLSQRITKRS
jgi:hypothetical protein